MRQQHSQVVEGVTRTIPIPQAARVLGISAQLAYKLAQSGQFPCRVISLGRRRLVVGEDLERLLVRANDAAAGN